MALLFSVIISILKQSNILKCCSNFISPIFNLFSVPNQFCSPVLSGILELTNGIKEISIIPSNSISINIILCSFVLRFWWYICFAAGF